MTPPEGAAPALTLYFAPWTRSVRVAWLLEELALPYRLERVEFLPPAKAFFAQRTPTGKLPTLVDGDVVLCESGAIVEYVIERHEQLTWNHNFPSAYEVPAP